MGRVREGRFIANIRVDQRKLNPECSGETRWSIMHERKAIFDVRSIHRGRASLWSCDWINCWVHWEHAVRTKQPRFATKARSSLCADGVLQQHLLYSWLGPSLCPSIHLIVSFYRLSFLTFLEREASMLEAVILELLSMACVVIKSKGISPLLYCFLKCTSSILTCSPRILDGSCVNWKPWGIYFCGMTRLESLMTAVHGTADPDVPTLRATEHADAVKDGHMR